MPEVTDRLDEARPRRFQPYLEYRDSGIEWLGEIPAHWNVNRLRATVTGCQNGVWGDDADEVHDLICVRVADFDRVQFRVRLDEPTMRSIEPRIAQTRKLKEADLLLEKSGGGDKQPVGAVVMYGHGETAVCSNFVARMPVTDGYHPRYLTYLHAALYAARINVRSIKQSTGIQNLDSKSYLNESVGLPTGTEQRAIAAFLDRETAKIDGLVASKERLIELLQEKRTALITSAVTRGLDPNVPMKDSGVEWLGEIPAHWEVIRTRFLCDMTTGDKDTQDAMEEGEYPFFVRSDNVERLPTYTFDGEGVLTSGDGAGVGKIFHHYIGKFDFHQRVYLFCHFRRVVGRFFYYFVKANLCKVVLALSAKSTVDSLRRPMLQDFPVAVGPEQAEIVAFLDRETENIDALTAKAHQAIALLKEFRTALISAAVTGKIDVRGQAA